MRAGLPSASEYASEEARFGPMDTVDVQSLQRDIDSTYLNQVLVDFNGGCMRMAVFEGEYRWHLHPASDEVFLVVDGELHIEFAEHAERILGPWQCITVPAGTVHRTRAAGRTVNLTFEMQNTETVFID